MFVPKHVCFGEVVGVCEFPDVPHVGFHGIVLGQTRHDWERGMNPNLFKIRFNLEHEIVVPYFIVNEGPHQLPYSWNKRGWKPENGLGLSQPSSETGVASHKWDESDFGLLVLDRLCYMKVTKANLDTGEHLLERRVQSNFTIGVHLAIA